MLQTTKTMLSTEIAALTNKRHDNVMRDIRTIIEQLGDSSDLSSDYISTTYVAGNGKDEVCFSLTHDAVMVVLTGYDVVARTKVIKRWKELEGQQKPMSHLEILAQSALALVEQERRLTVTEQQVAEITIKIESLEVDLRNGVPANFLSKSNAYKQYALGLSRAIFDAVMLQYGITTQKYVHTENGHSTSTFAYKEDEIEAAILDFIDNAEQTSSAMCYSKVLNKKFGFIKGEVK